MQLISADEGKQSLQTPTIDLHKSPFEVSPASESTHYIDIPSIPDIPQPTPEGRNGGGYEHMQKVDRYGTIQTDQLIAAQVTDSLLLRIIALEEEVAILREYTLS